MPLEWRLAWRNVWRNPRRTALTVAATVHPTPSGRGNPDPKTPLDIAHVEGRVGRGMRALRRGPTGSGSACLGWPWPFRLVARHLFPFSVMAPGRSPSTASPTPSSSPPPTSVPLSLPLEFLLLLLPLVVNKISHLHLKFKRNILLKLKNCTDHLLTLPLPCLTLPYLTLDTCIN